MEIMIYVTFNLEIMIESNIYIFMEKGGNYDMILEENLPCQKWISM